MKPATIVTTSWDDGHPLDHRLSALLHRHGLAATFYIPRKSQLATLSENQVRQLSEQFEIGAHTLDHLALTTLSDEEATKQIVESGDWVSQTTGKPCQMFCPPLGKFDRTHVASIAEAGYRGFRTVELLQTDRPRRRTITDQQTLWELPTSVQAHPHGRRAYLKNALKRRRWQTAVFAGCSFQSIRWAKLTQQLTSQVMSHGGVLHLWGHSWEIEQNQQWSILEDVCKNLGQQISNGAMTTLTNSELVRLSAGDSATS